jgi:hypothetical protein
VRTPFIALTHGMSKFSGHHGALRSQWSRQAGIGQTTFCEVNFVLTKRMVRATLHPPFAQDRAVEVIAIAVDRLKSIKL